ncbi:unnamed protein product, partial [Effrenium voratum]
SPKRGQRVCRGVSSTPSLWPGERDPRAMGKTYPELTEEQISWLKQQRVFFVASAPSSGGHVNVSPKGYVEGTFAVLSPRSVAYLDFTGSGSETVAHSLQNGRITICFTAFKGDPVILRLYGTAKAVPRSAADPLGLHFSEEFLRHPAFRAVILVEVNRVQSSCGYSIPFFEYQGEREVLKEHFGKRTREQMNEYRVLKNSFSIDQLPSIGHRVFNEDAPKQVVARLTGGFWYGYANPSWGERLGSWLSALWLPLRSRDLVMLGLGAAAALSVSKRQV